MLLQLETLNDTAELVAIHQVTTVDGVAHVAGQPSGFIAIEQDCLAIDIHLLVAATVLTRDIEAQGIISG